MTEIYSDQTNFETSNRYAQTQNALEQFRKQHYNTPGSNSTIEQGAASSASILVVAATPNHLDILTGSLVKTSWSLVQRPDGYDTQRPFSIYLAPSLGPPDNQEVAIKQVIAAMQQANPAQAANQPGSDLTGQPVLNMLTELQETNRAIDDVRARINQFIQV